MEKEFPIPPYSNQFSDYYYSSNGGYFESEYNFVLANKLPQRWEGFQGSNFTVLETGFGTGLNFLCTLNHWNRKKRHFQLTYVSLEKYPLTKNFIQRHLRAFPQIAGILEEFVDYLPSKEAPIFYRRFEKYGVNLIVLVGEAVEKLNDFTAKVDAVYLDGFDPKRNPDMWTKDLLERIALISHSETSLSTFSVASIVKQNLKESGFQIQKQPGFPPKREMLTAAFGFYPKIKKNERKKWLPVFSKLSVIGKVPPKNMKVAVIGSGIAGISVAVALNTRRIVPKIISVADIQPTYPPVALLQPNSGEGDTIRQGLEKSALYFAKRFYEKHVPGYFHELPLRNFPNLSNKRKQKETENLNRYEYKDSHAFCLSAQKACLKLLKKHGGETLDIHLDAIQIKEDRVVIEGKGYKEKFDAIVLTCGIQNETTDFLSNIAVKGGQLSGVSVSSRESVDILKSEQSLSYGGHAVFGPDEIWLGSSYRQSSDKNVYSKDDRHNINLFLEAVPQIKSKDVTITKQWTGTRSTTTDRQPMVGPLIPECEYSELYKKYIKGLPIDPNFEHESFSKSRIYTLSGMNSRGFTLAPFLAEILVSHITGETAPTYDSWLKFLHPSRFIAKRISKSRN